MQIHQNKSLAQPIGLALFVFFGAFVLSAFASHSFTPVGDSSALDSEVNVEIEPSLSLAILDKDPSVSSDATTIDTMSMEVTPTSDGTFISSTAYVQAGSNNETGYTLSFSDTDNNTALTNTDPAITTTIPSISVASSSLTDIATNQWGYAFDTDTVFSPIPALSSPVTLASTTVPASNVYPFTAASKIDMNVPAGTYQDSVIFSLVANYVAPKNYLQDMTLATCQSLPLNEQQIYADRRDNKKYTIARLADGNCWMTQNLRLGSGKEVTLTPADSNVSSNFTLPKAPTEVSSWGANTIAADVDQIHLYDTNSVDDGVYYNWYTATAGTGLYDNTTANAASSICPKGWRLPTGGANGDFQVLYAAEGNDYGTFTSNNIWSLSGTYSYAGFINPPGGYGYWWSSTPGSAAYSAFALRVDTSDVTPQNSGSKAYGLSVRCIYESRTITDISNMQDINSQICANTPIGTSSTLVDTRDNVPYTVGKLVDGKCWMTRNLKIGSATKDTILTPLDSDMLQNFTIPKERVQSAGSTDWSTDVDSVRVYDNGSIWIQPTSVGNVSTVSTTGQPAAYSQYVGSYYNWFTATAGTGTDAMTFAEATSSICPKGWRLPKGGPDGEQVALSGAAVGIYTNSTSVPNESFVLQVAPYHLVFSGYYDKGAFERGASGRWWSSTAFRANTAPDQSIAYSIRNTSSQVGPHAGDLKYRGHLVRCLAR